MFRNLKNRTLNDLMRIFVTILLLIHGPVLSLTATEYPSLDGTGNDLNDPLDGAAGQPIPRISYGAEYPGDGTGSTMISAQRANPRDISNAVGVQSGSFPSSRGLSDYIWAWSQFATHDIGHTQTSNGAETNGSAPIAVNDPTDPLAGNPIPFTRSNFIARHGGVRHQINSVSSYMDGSQVYGSDPTRAAALRTNGGTGARLATSAGNLLPFNEALLSNDNNGPFPDARLFLAGDVRANENVMLTSLQTIFMREHNRLVDLIEIHQSELDDEQTYQLARNLVAAQLQIVTYNEFLPALLGEARVPLAQDYDYQPGVTAAVTQSFTHAAFRFGHSAVSPAVQLIRDDGSRVGQLELPMASANPDILASNPENLELLLKGAASQVSQEIDIRVVDELRNLLFGPPGSGGMDLLSLDIQRGRDHGIPDYQELLVSYQVPLVTSFDAFPSEAGLAAALSAVYEGNISNVDAIIGILAEERLPGSSLGELGTEIISDQFARLRDGDRFFYLNDDLGLYHEGLLNPHIAAIIDLDSVTLAGILEANTSLTSLQDNLFFAVHDVPGDIDGSGVVDAADLDLVLFHWGAGADELPEEWLNGRPENSEQVGTETLNHALFHWNQSTVAAPVPEPSAAHLLWLAALVLAGRSIRTGRPQVETCALFLRRLSAPPHLVADSVMS